MPKSATVVTKNIHSNDSHLKHFIIQQMHKYIIHNTIRIIKYLKIFYNNSNCIYELYTYASVGQ